MTDDGFSFDSRLRKNVVMRVLEPIELPIDSIVLSDEMIVIGTKQSRAENLFRLIKVLIREVMSYISLPFVLI